MEALKIVALCIVAAIAYGIIHDQITARVCIEYFTVFHPPIFHTQSPTLLGIGWGIIATWWVGAFFSVPMILASRAGSRPTLRASELLPSIIWLLATMGACALLAGVTGYLLAREGVLNTDWLPFSYSPTMRNRLLRIGGHTRLPTPPLLWEGLRSARLHIESGVGLKVNECYRDVTTAASLFWTHPVPRFLSTF